MICYTCVACFILSALDIWICCINLQQSSTEWIQMHVLVLQNLLVVVLSTYKVILIMMFDKSFNSFSICWPTMITFDQNLYSWHCIVEMICMIHFYDKNQFLLLLHTSSVLKCQIHFLLHTSLIYVWMCSFQGDLFFSFFIWMDFYQLWTEPKVWHAEEEPELMEDSTRCCKNWKCSFRKWIANTFIGWPCGWKICNEYPFVTINNIFMRHFRRTAAAIISAEVAHHLQGVELCCLSALAIRGNLRSPQLPFLQDITTNYTSQHFAVCKTPTYSND